MYILPTLINDYNFQILSREHVSPSAALLAELFHQYEPIVSSLVVSKDLLYSCINEVVGLLVEQELCVIAQNVNTQQIDAVLLNVDHQSPPAVSEYPELSPIFVLMEEFKNEYYQRSGNEEINTRLIEHFMIGIKPGITSHREVFTNLLSLSQTLALSKGFAGCMVIMTSPWSQYMYREYMDKEKNVCWLEKQYRDFKYEGKPIFEDVASKLPEKISWQESDPFYTLSVDRF